MLTPLSAYRAFHLKHHQTTNREGDPNGPLNSRWMLGVGSFVYATLIHLHAWRNLRGRPLVRYVLEMAGMTAFLAAVAVFLPRSMRDRAWLLPLLIVIILQNIRIVSEHLDLPSGRYHDTWQLALPGWASGWILHYDHHLEHHLRPGLHWHELPAYRARLIARETELGLRRVTLGEYFRDVFLKPRARSSDRSRRATDSAQKREDDAPSDQDQRRRLRFRVDAPATAPTHKSGAGPRYHGLDAMRGTTMALGRGVARRTGLCGHPDPEPDLGGPRRGPTACFRLTLLVDARDLLTLLPHQRFLRRRALPVARPAPSPSTESSALPGHSWWQGSYFCRRPSSSGSSDG